MRLEFHGGDRLPLALVWSASQYRPKIHEGQLFADSCRRSIAKTPVVVVLRDELFLEKPQHKHRLACSPRILPSHSVVPEMLSVEEPRKQTTPPSARTIQEPHPMAFLWLTQECNEGMHSP